MLQDVLKKGVIRVRRTVVFIREIAKMRIRYGCRCIHVLVRPECWAVNDKRGSAVVDHDTS